MTTPTMDRAETGGTYDVRKEDLIAIAITEAFGERCDDFGEYCPCCLAWKQYDSLRAGEAPDSTMSLAAFLDGKGIAQKDFAASVGVDPATICRIVKGKQEPGAGIVARIELATNGAVNAQSWRKG